MNCYYDRKDFMASHKHSEYYIYCQGHTCKGCEKEKKALVNPNQLGRSSKLLVRSLKKKFSM